MVLNNADNENLYCKLKLKLGLYHVVLKTLKPSPQKVTVTVVEMQQFPDSEKTDSKEEITCLKSTVYNGRTEVCVNFKTDTNNLSIVWYRYRKNLYLKNNEVHLKLTK